MDLTPRDIQEKQFHDAFRGYNHEEVDMFLDAAAEAFEKVFRENQTLLHRIREIEEHLGEARGSEDMLKRMLLTAQKTADDAIEEARTKAQGMVVAAERKAQEIVANAERRSQEIVADAQTKERELQVNLEGLKRFDSEYRARLKAFIESQLRVLAEGPIGVRAAGAEAPAPVSPPSATEPSPSVADQSAPKVPPSETPVPEPRPTPDSETAPGDEVPLGASKSPRPDVPKRAAVSPSTGPGSRDEDSGPKPGGRPDEEDEEDRSIKELFWGDE